MKFIFLNVVSGTTGGTPARTEEDDMGNTVVVEPGTEAQEVTLRTGINPAFIRSFAQRKPRTVRQPDYSTVEVPRIGTRIVFENKTALAVTNTPDEVEAMLAAL